MQLRNSGKPKFFLRRQLRPHPSAGMPAMRRIRVDWVAWARATSPTIRPPRSSPTRRDGSIPARIAPRYSLARRSISWRETNVARAGPSPSATNKSCRPLHVRAGKDGQDRPQQQDDQEQTRLLRVEESADSRLHGESAARVPGRHAQLQAWPLSSAPSGPSRGSGTRCCRCDRPG